jgi:hypothetical protein
MVDTTEQKWFKGVTFVLSGFFTGVFLASAIYWDRIRRNKGGGGVTQGEATAMEVITIISAVLCFALFIWALVRLFIGSSTRELLVNNAQAYLTSQSNGLLSQSTQNALVNATAPSSQIIPVAPSTVTTTTATPAVIRQSSTVTSAPGSYANISGGSVFR